MSSGGWGGVRGRVSGGRAIGGDGGMGVEVRGEWEERDGRTRRASAVAAGSRCTDGPVMGEGSSRRVVGTAVRSPEAAAAVRSGGGAAAVVAAVSVSPAPPWPPAARPSARRSWGRRQPGQLPAPAASRGCRTAEAAAAGGRPATAPARPGCSQSPAPGQGRAAAAAMRGGAGHQRREPHDGDATQQQHTAKGEHMSDRG